MRFTFALRLLAVIGAWGGIVFPVAYQLRKGVNGYTPVTRAFGMMALFVAWNITRSLWHLQAIDNWTPEQIQYQLETSFYQLVIVLAGMTVVWFKAKSEK